LKTCVTNTHKSVREAVPHELAILPPLGKTPQLATRVAGLDSPMELNCDATRLSYLSVTKP